MCAFPALATYAHAADGVAPSPSAAAAELFRSGYLSTVKELRLADGREVVVKVRPCMPRLTGCAIVYRALWTAGSLCPEPLVDP
jgi:hypothetical protein